jgi:hypothetical protein
MLQGAAVMTLWVQAAAPLSYTTVVQELKAAGMYVATGTVSIACETGLHGH